MVDILQLAAITVSRNSDNYTLLVETIRHLINNDFEKLIQLLYRMDVSEKRIKESLNTSLDRDAAMTIADLMIERQAQKNASFQSNKLDNDIPEDEKW